MKIAIFSNVNQRCGVATYGEQLRNAIAVQVSHTLLTPNVNEIIEFDPDATIINFHEAVANLSVPDAQRIRDTGSKLILIFQTSFPQTAKTQAEYPDLIKCIYPLAHFVDAVTAHEKMDLDIPVRFIPHGIPEVDDLPAVDKDFFVGTAGFASDMKNLESIMSICYRVGAKIKLVLPAPETMGDYAGIQNLKLPAGSTMSREWLPIEETVKILATCTANIFFFKSTHYSHDTGQSGSARMGVAAKRPLVLSTHRKFRTLIDGYEDQTYVAHSEDEAVLMLTDIWRKSVKEYHEKIPYQILGDQGWSVIAGKYLDLIEEVMYDPVKVHERD